MVGNCSRCSLLARGDFWIRGIFLIMINTGFLIGIYVAAVQICGAKMWTRIPVSHNALMTCSLWYSKVFPSLWNIYFSQLGAEANLQYSRINDAIIKDYFYFFKNKPQNKNTDTKELVYSIWPPFFSIIVSICLRNDVDVFKIESSDILFHFSSIAVLSEPILGSEVEFVFFAKTLYIA